MLLGLGWLPWAVIVHFGYVTNSYVIWGGWLALAGFLAGRWRRFGERMAALADRTEELTHVNRIGRLLAGTLERDQLLGNIALEALRLLPKSSRLMIGVVDGPDWVNYSLFDEHGQLCQTLRAPRDEGLSGWVMAHRQALRLGDVQGQYALYSKTSTYNDPRSQSWLGAPLIVYNNIMGVLAVQSAEPQVYMARAQRFLTLLAEQAALALENARLYDLATVDGLTDLYVRRYFDQRLQEEWQRSRRHDVPFTLGILDVDNFKILNDTYGHQAGDEVLRAVAAALRRTMRGSDLAARYGGEEFAFILPRTTAAEARRFAERIRIDIEKMLVPFSGQRLRATVSIGLASYPESDVVQVADLLTCADQALYQAKHAGKNRVVAAVDTHAPSDAPSAADWQAPGLA